MKTQLISLCLLFLLNGIAIGQNKLGLVFSYSSGMASPNGVQLDTPLDILQYDFTFQSQDAVKSMGISSIRDLGNFFLRADIVFRTTAYNFEMQDFRDRSGTRRNTYKTSYQQFHIPISAGVKIGPARIGTGPVMNFIMDSEMHEDIRTVFDIRERNKYFGFQFLVALDLGKHASLEAKYENTFTSVSDGYYYEKQKVNIKTSPNLFTLGLAVYL